MDLATAVEHLPKNKDAFNKARYRWVAIVRGHPFLTPGQRQVGIVIAQQHINHNPEMAWFHTAWAAHQTIADETGLTRRTVVSAMLALKRIGLIAIEHGGGRKVPGGRTDRFTLRMDRLDVLEQAAEIERRKDVKILHGVHDQTSSKFHKSGEKNAESGEIDVKMMRNPPSEGVKELRTTLSNTNPLGGPSTTHDRLPTLAVAPAATQRTGKGRKEDSGSVTAQDHRELAELLGQGNIEHGYCRLFDLNESDANDLALRYRDNRSSGEAVRAEAARLEACQGRSG